MADNENETEKGTAVEQGLEDVAKAASEVADAAAAAASSPVKKNPARTLDFILDVSLQVTVEVGRSRMTIHDLLQLGQGSVVELEKLAGEPLDIYINGKAVARGEAVIVNEKFGVRLTDIISPEDRIEGLERR